MASNANLGQKKKCSAQKADFTQENQSLKRDLTGLTKQVELLTVSAQKGEMAEAELNQYKQTFAQLFDQGVIDS